MLYIEKVLNTKPTDEAGNRVYATNIGWCIKQKFQAKQEEVVYEYRSLLNILEEHGYDKYGQAVTDEPAGSSDADSGSEDVGNTESDSNVDDGSAESTEPDGDDNIGDTDPDADPDAGADTGTVPSTETETETEVGGSEDGADSEQSDGDSDSATVKYTQADLEDMPDMKALREVAQKFNVNDISKAKLIAKILEAQGE